MMRAFSKSPFAGLIILALLLLFSVTVAAQENPTDEPSTLIEATSEPFEMSFGSGPFSLVTPSKGLSDLTSYRAMLTVQFDGSNAGEVQTWTRTYTLLFMQEPLARQLTINASDDSDGSVMRAEINGTFYEWRESSVCIASVIEADTSFAEEWDPASFLDSVSGAEEAGSESVSGIPSNHYTFDESAIAASGIAESTGELWVAADVGYLVRYTLETTGGQDYFGEGIEGTLRWDYQLHDVNSPLVIEIPDSCPPGLLDFPMLPDAANILESPGMTSYTTIASLEDTLAFYQEQVSALGGEVVNAPLLTESAIFLGFTIDDRQFLLIADSDLAGTIIELYEADTSIGLEIFAEIPDERGTQPEPTASVRTTSTCEPGTSGVPITPDATSIQDMGMALSYMTTMSLADVAAFYEEQLAALGAQVSSPMPASDFMAMLNVQQNNESYSVMIAPAGATTNVTISAMTMQTTITACMPESTGPTATVASPGVEPTAASGGCPRGLLPLLPDATNIQDIAGTITYTTSASVPEAVAFYEEQFTALGAQLVPQTPVTEALASPMFMLDELPIFFTIIAQGDGRTSISISIMGSNPFRGTSPCS